MENFNVTKISLIESVSNLCKAIDTEVDWYIASFSQKDKTQREFARMVFEKKCKETALLAKEMYERYK